jgi:hypothetical protein
MSRQALIKEAARRGKYAKLYDHLSALQFSEWATDFRAIEKIVGFELPKSARAYRPWSANDINHSQAIAWMATNWRTSAVDMDSETLVFTRI